MRSVLTLLSAQSLYTRRELGLTAQIINLLNRLKISPVARYYHDATGGIIYHLCNQTTSDAG